MTKSEAKKALRSQFRSRRQEIDDDSAKNMSRLIGERLADLDQVSEAETLLFFWPLLKKKEVDLRLVMQRLQKAGKKVYLPVITRTDAARIEAVVYSSEDDLIKGPFDLMQPSGSPVLPEILDVIIVPGLAFDSSGHRIGYGGGYYDRFLSEPKIRARTIGVCFDEFFVEEVIHDRHDVSVDSILTPSKWIEIDKNATGE